MLSESRNSSGELPGEPRRTGAPQLRTSITPPAAAAECLGSTWKLAPTSRYELAHLLRRTARCASCVLSHHNTVDPSSCDLTFADATKALGRRVIKQLIEAVTLERWRALVEAECSAIRVAGFPGRHLIEQR
jgi:hypothetical protein